MPPKETLASSSELILTHPLERLERQIESTRENDWLLLDLGDISENDYRFLDQHGIDVTRREEGSYCLMPAERVDVIGPVTDDLVLQLKALKPDTESFLPGSDNFSFYRAGDHHVITRRIDHSDNVKANVLSNYPATVQKNCDHLRSSVPERCTTDTLFIDFGRLLLRPRNAAFARQYLDWQSHGVFIPFTPGSRNSLAGFSCKPQSDGRSIVAIEFWHNPSAEILSNDCLTGESGDFTLRHDSEIDRYTITLKLSPAQLGQLEVLRMPSPASIGRIVV